jgi:Phage gp6-like head-tail connector protein
MLLTLPEMKDHQRIELANTDHDDLLDRLAISADAWARNFLNVDSLEEFDTDSSPPESPFALPEDLKSGLLMHVEAMFSRDEAMMEKLLKTAEWLVMPYRQELGV